jgi:hypothetical protein
MPSEPPRPAPAKVQLPPPEQLGIRPPEPDRLRLPQPEELGLKPSR